MNIIDTAQLKAFLESSKGYITVINTLQESSFSSTEIPGSINVPQDSPDFVDRIKNELGSQSQPVIVYCASESCHSATEAARKLDEAGFASVFCYAGGAAKWKDDGNSLASERQPDSNRGQSHLDTKKEQSR